MSADEFWKDDPQLFVSYRTSFINKKKRELEETDYKCWLHGLYNHNGNGLLFASLKQFLHNLVSGLFKGKKDSKKIESYPAKPYSELQKDKEKENKLKEKEKRYQEYQKSLIYFGTMKQRYLDGLKNKSKERG